MRVALRQDPEDLRCDIKVSPASYSLSGWIGYIMIKVLSLPRMS